MKDDTEIFGLMNQKNGDDGRGAVGGRSLKQELDLNEVSWRCALAVSGQVSSSLWGGARSRGTGPGWRQKHGAVSVQMGLKA